MRPVVSLSSAGVLAALVAIAACGDSMDGYGTPYDDGDYGGGTGTTIDASRPDSGHQSATPKVGKPDAEADAATDADTGDADDDAAASNDE